MRKIIFFAVITASCLLVSCGVGTMTLEERLETLPGATVTKIENDTLFAEAYEISIFQPLDHNNPDGPGFRQQVFLGFAGADRPVVVETEGYSARFGKDELARILNGNQIIIEHRYFEDSRPDSIDWKYLTTWQAATDQHRVIELFKPVFQGKWLTTGISKGGQTVMFHSYYYPHDVDVRVAYVAPLNLGPEDPRFKPFLENVATPECRQRVYDFQKLALEKFDVLFPMLLSLAQEKGWTFNRIGGAGRAYEMTILEYEFAFWQWGRTPCDSIPLEGSDEKLFNHLARVGDFTYFTDQGLSYYEPFFYQAMTEIGYYGYDFDRFKGLLRYADDNGSPEFLFSAPQGVSYQYDYDYARRVDGYIKTKARNFIFLYGEYDPWSATAIDPGSNRKVLKIVKPGGSHGTRIKNLPDEQKELVLSKLSKWLDVTPADL